VGIGVLAFGAYHLALGLLMALAPGTFFDRVGPFGLRNDHYIRDTASFELAFGVLLLVAYRLRSWRAPVLAVVALQFLLHSVNHLIDIGDADPGWVGYFDFVSLAISTGLLTWLYSRARAA
jgi:hypothetical protein